MIIESLADLNEAGGCCCPITIPAHTEPSAEAEQISLTQGACFQTEVTANGGTGQYRRRDESYTATRYASGGGVIESGTLLSWLDKRWTGTSCDFTSGSSGSVPGSPSLTGTRQESTTVEVGVPPENYTKTVTFRFYRNPGLPTEYLYWETVRVTTYSDAYLDAPTEIKAEMQLAFDALNFPDDATPGSATSRFNYSDAGDGSVQLTKARYRWPIPPGFPFGYLKLTWDILEEPEGWDDPAPTVFRSFAAQDLTWEWDGMATESPWFSLAEPDVEGVRRIVNLRYQVYRSTRLGAAAIPIGEAVGDDEL